MSKVQDVKDSFAGFHDERKSSKDLKQQRKELEKLEKNLTGCRSTYKDNLDIQKNHGAMRHTCRMVIEENEKNLPDLEAVRNAAAAALAVAEAEAIHVKSERDRDLAPSKTLLDEIKSEIETLEKDRNEISEEIEQLKQEETNSNFNSQFREVQLEKLDDSLREKEELLEEKESHAKDIEREISDIEGKYRSKIIALDAAVAAAGLELSAAENKVYAARSAISKAKERLERIAYVLAHPEETPRLKSAIEQLEAFVVSQRGTVEEAENVHAAAKERTRLAKRIIAISALVLIVVIFCAVEIIPRLAFEYRVSSNAVLQGADVGDIVELGSYEQDGDTSDGSEPIEWVIVDIENDSTGGYAILLSERALSCMPYKADADETLTWDASNLHYWLEQDFNVNAFSSDEKGFIQNGEADIMTSNQLYKWVDEDYRTCKPTDYAVEMGAVPDKSTGNCSWWLSDDAELDNGYNMMGCYVDQNGDVGSNNVQGITISARPYVKVYL